MTGSYREVTVAGRRFRVALTKATSERLARVRRAKTDPEVAVREQLRALGIRFHAAKSDLPGSPDFANRSRKWAIFVHGCYWHHHAGCSRATIPKANRDFWLAKFEDNRRRDRRAVRSLRKLGYSVVTIWECTTSRPDKLKRQLIRGLGGIDGKFG